MMMKNAENLARLQAYEGDPIERIDLLETHLRRALEAGHRLLEGYALSTPATRAWDQVTSDAEGVLRG